MGNKLFCYKICTHGFIFKEAVFFYEKVGSKAPLRFKDPWPMDFSWKIHTIWYTTRPPEHWKTLKNLKEKFQNVFQNFQNYANLFWKNIQKKVVAKPPKSPRNIKVPRHPKISRGIEKCKKKKSIFSQQFPKFCQSLFENFVPKKFFEQKKFTIPPKHRETSRKWKKIFWKKSGTLPDFGGRSWLLGWRSGTQNCSNV